jgi:CRP-like cAMP-binding protein
VYGPARDIEWAYADDQIYLLQCRAVTHRSQSRPRIALPEGPGNVIKQVPLFTGLSERDVVQIASMFKERTFPAGETITKEGVGAAAFFVIESGEAMVSIHGKQIRTLGAGARSATVTASTEVICHGLTYWEFRPLVQTNATIAWNLLQTLAKRLRSAQNV